MIAARCRHCGRTNDLIRGDGPIVCRICVWRMTHSAAEIMHYISLDELVRRLRAG